MLKILQPPSLLLQHCSSNYRQDDYFLNSWHDPRWGPGYGRDPRGPWQLSFQQQVQPSTLHIPNIVHQYSKLVPGSEPTINQISNTTVSKYKIPRKEQKIQQCTIRSYMQGIHISKARRQFRCSCHCHYLRVFLTFYFFCCKMQH